MRNVTHLVVIVVTLVVGAAVFTPETACAAHCGSRGDTYAEAMEAKAAAARAADRRAAAQRAARRDAAAIARFERMYGSRVARWYPLVRRYFPGHVRDALYVMDGESDGRPGVTNAAGTCRGLWQINQCNARKFREVTGLAYFWGVFDPEANARFAAYMSRGGRDWSSWSVRS